MLKMFLNIKDDEFLYDCAFLKKTFEGLHEDCKKKMNKFKKILTIQKTKKNHLSKKFSINEIKQCLNFSRLNKWKLFLQCLSKML